jgi:hypothetical protein
MNGGEEIQRVESAEKVIMVEASGGGNEEYIAGAFGLAGVELGEDGSEKFGYREREEEGSEFMFPGGLRPGTGGGGGSRTDVQIVKKEESIDDRHVIHADSSDGGLSVFAVIGEASVLDRHKHDVKKDFSHIGEYINDPFVGGIGASGGVRLKKREDVGGGVGDSDFLNSKFSGLCLEGGEASGEGS